MYPLRSDSPPSPCRWVGWACGFADFDNDGQRDLWVANGHVYPKADVLASTSYLQPITVFANRRAKFSAATQLHGKDGPNSYRGGCAGDFNNDGKLDLLVLPIAGSPILLENRTQSSFHWLGLDLRGRSGNRDAIGSQVRVEACGTSQMEVVRNGGSFLSVDDPRLHFGLGACNKLDRLQVRWPNGRLQVLENLPVDRYLTVEEPN